MFDPLTETALEALRAKLLLTAGDLDKLALLMAREGQTAVVRRISELTDRFRAENLSKYPPDARPTLNEVQEWERARARAERVDVYEKENAEFWEWLGNADNENAVARVAWELRRLNKNIEDLRNAVDLRWEANRILDFIQYR